MPDKPKVLLVDDVEANLVALEAQLGSLRCHLVRATSGNDALRELLRQEFAVMLLDVQMPDMDGFEVAALARENPATHEVPIIFVTATLLTEEKVLQGYGRGAVDFLFKPLNPYVLRCKVQVFLELYQSKKKLADAILARDRVLKDLDAFNYSISHDLRAPLRHLDGFSQALLEDYGDQLDDKAKSYIDRIRSSAVRMGHLIDDLHRLSKIRGAELRLEKVDLTATAESIVGELRAVEPERAVEVTVQPGLTALGDRELLRIALDNLLRNAWKFTRKRPRAHIEVGQRKDKDGETVYYVEDDGVGFDMRFAGRLFQPFQRVHSAHEYEGTGIGLAVVERIVRNHHGRIWAESVPEVGTTFSFTLNAGSA